MNSYDSLWSIHTALSIIREGNTNLDEYKEIIDQHRSYAAETIHHHIYNWYPLGAPIISIPYVFIIDKFLEHSLAIDFHAFIKHEVPGGIPKGVERFIASTLVALSSVLIYFISSLFFDNRKYPLLLVFVFAFCTSAWSTASRGLWQHGPAMFLLTVSLYFLLLAKHTPTFEPWLIRFTGIPLAFSYVVRPTDSLSILILTIFIFLRHRKCFRAYCLWSMLVAIPFFLFNLHVYHSLFSSYYSLNQISVSPHFFEALTGMLFSPSRGVFMYSPILLFAMYGIFLKIKNKRMELLDYALLIIIVLHWLISSSHLRWWAGHSYGPRYFTDILPYFMYFLIPAVSEISKRRGIRKAVLVVMLFCAIAASFFIHYRGATSEDVHTWNASPINIDLKPSRAWDWHDIQFLRGLY